MEKIYGKDSSERKNEGVMDDDSEDDEVKKIDLDKADVMKQEVTFFQR